MRSHCSAPRFEQAKNLSLLANDQLRSLRQERPLVVIDRNTSVGRISYAGPASIESARPTLALGCYRSWNPAQPVNVLAAEDHTPDTPRPIRSWWHLVHEAATQQINHNPHPPIITAWVADQHNQALLGSQGTFVGMPTRTNSIIENKSELDRILTQAQVDTALIIPAQTYRDRLPDLARMRQDVGSDRLVIQTPTGRAGEGPFSSTMKPTSRDSLPKGPGESPSSCGGGPQTPQSFRCPTDAAESTSTSIAPPTKPSACPK